MSNEADNAVSAANAAYLEGITILENLGEQAFNDSLGFKQAFSMIPDDVKHPYQIDAFIRGYWRGREIKLCVDNPKYLERRNSLKFSEGTTITVVLKVIDEDQTPAILGALYHQNDPGSYLAGCEALSVSKGNLHDQLNDIRKDVFNICEKHQIIGISGR